MGLVQPPTSDDVTRVFRVFFFVAWKLGDFCGNSNFHDPSTPHPVHVTPEIVGLKRVFQEKVAPWFLGLGHLLGGQFFVATCHDMFPFRIGMSLERESTDKGFFNMRIHIGLKQNPSLKLTARP